jgi:hypothetical protein
MGRKAPSIRNLSTRQNERCKDPSENTHSMSGSLGRRANRVVMPTFVVHAESVTWLAEQSLRSEYLNHLNACLSEP